MKDLNIRFFFKSFAAEKFKNTLNLTLKNLDSLSSPSAVSIFYNMGVVIKNTIMTPD